MKDLLQMGDPAPDLAAPSVREILTGSGLRLTPSESKLVQVLLADYPISGLGTATSLARLAKVSDPTVVRLVAKLGFDGFADFQSRLLAEVEARLRSPLLMMEAKRPGLSEESGVGAYTNSVERAMRRTQELVPLHLYDQASRMLFSTKGEVLVLGGRFSRNIAGMLASYLLQLRAGVADLGQLSPNGFDRLIDLGRRDLLVVFDYRRYQSDVIAFCRHAASRGVPIVLFTDPWRSPIAELAEVTLMAECEAESPYDTLAPAVMQMEALVAHAVGQIGTAERRRMEALEGVRRDIGVTLDRDFTGERGPPGGRGPKAGRETSR